MLILRIKAEVNGNSLTVEFRLMIALWYKYWVLFNHLSACSNCISSMEFVLMTASLVSVWSSTTWVYLVKLSQVKFLAMLILRIKAEVTEKKPRCRIPVDDCILVKYWVLINHLSACNDRISSMEFYLMTTSQVSAWSSSTWVYLVKLSQVSVWLCWSSAEVNENSLMLNSGWWLHLSINITECSSTTWVPVMTASQVWNSIWWLRHELVYGHHLLECT